MEQFNHQIDSNDLSSSRIQVLNEHSINDNYDQVERSHLQNQLQIDQNRYQNIMHFGIDFPVKLSSIFDQISAHLEEAKASEIL